LICGAHVAVITRKRLPHTPVGGAGVIEGARVSVITGIRGLRVKATLLLIAAVHGAGVSIVAGDIERSHARSFVTRRGARAGVRVITRSLVERVETAIQSVAEIVGAQVPVIAWDIERSHARSFVTRRGARAGVLVITRSLVERVGAAVQSVAEVIGAQVLVITGDIERSHARSLVTRRGARAGVLVITRSLVERVGAAVQSVAEIVGAQVLVITGDIERSHARSLVTRRGGRAGVLVITRSLVERVETAIQSVAEIVGAEVPVITLERPTADARARRAGVGGGAQVPVVARRRVVVVHTAQAGVTAVVGAQVAVITLERLRSHALALYAGRGGRAQVAVITGLLVVLEDAPLAGVAHVVRARISVITAQLPSTRDAATIDAVISQGAHACIITGSFVVRHDASGGRVTAAVGARIVVHAGRARGRDAGATLALGAVGAGVAVVTGQVVGFEDAVAAIALLVGTRVPVVATQDDPARARALDARVIKRARVSVVTGAVHWRVRAASVRQARVDRARVLVVARQGPGSHTGALDAGVPDRALVEVVASLVVGHEETAQARVAGVVGTGVAVRARELGGPRLTGASAAVVTQGAHVAVITCLSVVDVDAAQLGVAAVGRAVVTVVTALGFGGHACALVALRHARAGVEVVASFEVGHEHAPTLIITGVVGAAVLVVTDHDVCAGLAAPLSAGIALGAHIQIVARQGVGRWDAARLQVAGVRRAGVLVVAVGRLARHTGTVCAARGRGTRVGVITALGGRLMKAARRAAGVDGARVLIITLQGDIRDARPVIADVSYGARISIITQPRDGIAGATSCPIALVLCARVLVVTLHGSAYADTLFAVVDRRAGIAVEALVTLHGGVHAPGFAFAGVGRARVFIITGGLIGQPITVVVEPVAGLLWGLEGVARLQAIRRADERSRALAELVAHRARGGRAALYGQLRALTTAGLGDAMRRLHSRGRLRLLTRVASRAWGLKVTGAAAKAAACRINHTGVWRVTAAALGGVAR
jgi:hypothetical protein